MFVDGTPGNVTDQGAVTFWFVPQRRNRERKVHPPFKSTSTTSVFTATRWRTSTPLNCLSWQKEGKITLVLQPVGMMGDFSRIATGALYYLAENAPEQALAFNNKVFSELTAPLFDGVEPQNPRLLMR